MIGLKNIVTNKPARNNLGKLNSLVMSNWTQQKYLDGLTFDNGKIVLQFDDAWESVYTALPLFLEKGIKVTTFANVYVVNQHTAYNGFYQMTWAQLRDFVANGMDVQCHGYKGERLDTLNDLQVQAEIVDNTSGFVANGLPVPTEIAYSGGSYDDSSLKIVDNYRQTGRTIKSIGYVNRKSSKFELEEAASLGGVVNDIKLRMLYAKERNLMCVISGHMIGVADSLSISLASLEEIIDYGILIGLDFITTKKARELLFYNDIRLSRDCPDTQIDVICKPDVPAGTIISLERSTDGINYAELTTLVYPSTDYSDEGLTLNTNYFYRSRVLHGSKYLPYSRVASISTPVQMSVKSTGTGGAVTAIQIKTTRAMTLSFSGNARFYSDAAGTLNESTTKDIPRYELTMLYIRCLSGTSTLTFPNNEIEWFSQSSVPVNSPAFAFDISKFTKLRSISFGGYNEITGSISNLTDLETLYLGDANTISGSLTNLVKLTYIKLYGTNTVGGSISNLIDLTYIYVYSLTHSITGNITNLTKLTYIYLNLTSTITGSITNLTKLTTIELLGTTLSGNITNLVLLTKLSILGAGNTITGAITNLISLITLNVEGSNTLSGNIDNLTALTTCTVKGANTVAGDLGVNNVVNGITTLNLNPCAMINYTGGAVWSNATVTINPSVGYGYSSAEIDLILIDMAASPTLISKTITLRGSNAARTAASDAAVATLQGVGRTCTLLLN